MTGEQREKERERDGGERDWAEYGTVIHQPGLLQFPGLLREGRKAPLIPNLSAALHCTMLLSQLTTLEYRILKCSMYERVWFRKRSK